MMSLYYDTKLQYDSAEDKNHEKNNQFAKS